MRGDQSVISFSVESVSNTLYQPCSSWGGSPMNGSPGFQNCPGRGGRLSAAQAHGMTPAIGVVGSNDCTSPYTSLKYWSRSVTSDVGSKLPPSRGKPNSSSRIGLPTLAASVACSLTYFFARSSAFG